MTARHLQARAELSTVNSRVAAEFDKLNGAPIQLESVNGAVLLTLPSDSQGDIEASTVSGSISDDFGIGVRDHEYVGHDLRARLGNGGTQIRLENVNGPIEVRRASDNHRVSQVTDLNHSAKDTDDEVNDRSANNDNDSDNDNDNDDDNDNAD